MTDISTIGTFEKTIQIVHPATKEPLDISVSLMSPDDKRLEPYKNALTNKRLAEQSKSKTPKAEELAKDRDMFLFRAMTGWSWENSANFEGEKPDFIQVKVLKVFDTLPWFRRQVDEAFSELESFFEITESN